MVPGGHETLQPSVQRHDRQRARDQDFRSSACISADVYMEPVSGFEPLTCRLQGAIGPLRTVAGRRLVSHLPAPIVAGRWPTSVTARLRRLPLWLPASGVPAVSGLHMSGFADTSSNSRPSRSCHPCLANALPPTGPRLRAHHRELRGHDLLGHRHHHDKGRPILHTRAATTAAGQDWPASCTPPRRVASHLAVVATPVGAIARRGAGSGGRPMRTHARGQVVGRTGLRISRDHQPRRHRRQSSPRLRPETLFCCAVGDVRWADQEGRSMMGTVVFRGAPNQLQSASRSAVAAVPTGSPVVAAQAM
jgi:hypothetical protein